MHALSVVALALGAVAVSAQDCAPYCQFPKSITCPGNGQTLTRDELIAAAVAGDRTGTPYEESTYNIATEFCRSPDFKGVPLWATSLPKQSGSLLYALNDKGTFFFCSTQSGRHSSGYPLSCKVSN